MCDIDTLLSSSVRDRLVFVCERMLESHITLVLGHKLVLMCIIIILGTVFVVIAAYLCGAIG